MISPLGSSATDTDKSKTMDVGCAQFTEKFGTTASELVNFVNNEPDSAIVLKGYYLIYAKITGLIPNQYMPMVLNLDGNGKITDFSCDEPTAARDYSKDIDVTIPETDLAQIIRYRDTLETEQAALYLQNATTNPSEAKEIIVSRIQSLE